MSIALKPKCQLCGAVPKAGTEPPLCGSCDSDVDQLLADVEQDLRNEGKWYTPSQVTISLERQLEEDRHNASIKDFNLAEAGE